LRNILKAAINVYKLLYILWCQFAQTVVMTQRSYYQFNLNIFSSFLGFRKLATKKC